MDDEVIVSLYFDRDEAAIGRTAEKYGPFCRRVALNVLSSPEDAEECVNDAWLAAWKQIPPERPRSLRAFLGRIVRNLSISRFRADHAQKRGGGMEVLLSELEDCVPDQNGVEDALDRAELGALISRWLDAQPEEDRNLFIRRYWFGDGVGALAGELGRSANQVSQKLFRLRRSLRAALEWEGVSI